MGGLNWLRKIIEWSIKGPHPASESKLVPILIHGMNSGAMHITVKSVAAQGIFTCMSDKTYYCYCFEEEAMYTEFAALFSLVKTHFCQPKHVPNCLYIFIDSFKFSMDCWNELHNQVLLPIANILVQINLKMTHHQQLTAQTLYCCTVVVCAAD